MNPKDDKRAASEGTDEAQKPAPPRRFESTLPQGKKTPDGNGGGDLDLDLGDIQSRLPYGSEDIADK